MRVSSAVIPIELSLSGNPAVTTKITERLAPVPARVIDVDGQAALSCLSSSRKGDLGCFGDDSMSRQAQVHYSEHMATPLKPPDSDDGTRYTNAEAERHAAPEPSPPLSLVRQVVTWLCVVLGPLLVGIAFFPIIRAAIQQQPWLLTIFRQHYAAIFGLPGAALLSFILVVVFEARFDNIEMEIANLVKFRGASGPVILWVLCFLSIALAIKLLW
jgi:hypothetical protein